MNMVRTERNMVVIHELVVVVVVAAEYVTNVLHEVHGVVTYIIFLELHWKQKLVFE